MNVVELPQKDDCRAAIENLRRDMANQIELQRLIAEIRAASYVAHMEQGFTPEQALVLCMKVTFT